MRSDYRWNDDIRMNHMYIERKLVDYIHVTQDKTKRLAPENAVLIRLITFMWETS